MNDSEPLQQHSLSSTSFVVVLRFFVLVAYENLAAYYELMAEPAQTVLPQGEALEGSPVSLCLGSKYIDVSHSPNRKSRELIAFIFCGFMLLLKPHLHSLVVSNVV